MKQINSDELVELYNWFYCKQDQEHYEALDNAIDAATDLTPVWIPVSERLPKRGEFVLLAYAKDNRNPTMYAKNTMAVGRYDQKMFLVEGCSVKVTHWMPLPAPPKEVQK